MAITIRAYPYEVFVEDGKTFADDVLKKVDALKGAARWQDAGGELLTVDHLARIAGKFPRWEGAIQCVKTSDLPSRAGPGGTKPLDLDDDEGLGYHLAFLYDETANVLWLQRDRSILGRNHFFDYFIEKSGISISSVPKERADAVKRARKLKNIRAIEFAYVAKGDGDGVQKTGKIETMLKQLRVYGAARIEIRLVPKRGETLDPSAKQIIETLADEVDNDSDTIQKAKVSGRDLDTDPDTFIDLLHDRDQMFTRIDSKRLRDPLRLIAAVRDVWSANRDKV